MNYIENLRTIEEILKSHKELNGSLLHLERFSSRIEDIIKLAKKKKLEVSCLTKKELQKVCSKKNTPVVLVVDSRYFQSFVNVPKFLQETKNDTSKKLVVVLDKITDPQNLGNIFRSAELLGVDLLVLPKRNSSQVNDTVKNVSVGAIEYVKYVVSPSISSEIELLKKHGYWIYTSTTQGQNVYDVAFEDKTCLIIGNEEKGVSSLIKTNSDVQVSIPTKGSLDSFNVASACAILMYEIRKQQEFL